MTSEINPDEISIDYSAHQPAGSHGFRKGEWAVEYKGQAYKVFASVPHAAEMETQYAMVRAAAARHLAKTLVS
jgi:hypothetical protein